MIAARDRERGQLSAKLFPLGSGGEFGGRNGKGGEKRTEDSPVHAVAATALVALAV